MTDELVLLNEEEFDIEEHISNFSKKEINKPYSTDFKELQDFFLKVKEEELKAKPSEEQHMQLNIQHEAIIGNPDAINHIKDQIESFLSQHNVSNVRFPSHYKDLVDAIYHEVYGMSLYSLWDNYKDSQALQGIGLDIFVATDGEKRLLPQKFESLDKVLEICYALTMKDAHSRLSEEKPSLEVDLYDGTRVNIKIPPRTREPVITFRRHVVNQFSFEFQASKGTIPEESIPLFTSLSKLMLNTLVSGPVRSGKTTFMKTIFAERDPDLTVVCIEKNNFEVYLRRDFPGRPLIEIRGTEEELLQEIFPETLRDDVDYYIIAEVRGIESDLFIMSGQRGKPGTLGTYHTQFAENIPGMLARHVVDFYHNRKYEQELIRSAESIDLVITMKEEKDFSKRVTSVQQVILDPETLDITTNVIMQFDEEQKEWFYSYHLDERLFTKMKEQDVEQAYLFKETLENLARKKPIKGETTKTYLRSKGGHS